ncbi:MAG: TolB family protein [Actinomycetota bacterium]
MFLLALLPLTIGAGPAAVKSKLPGRIAYLRGGVVCIAPAAGGPELRAPGSKGAAFAALSPKGDTLLFFVPTGKSSREEYGRPMRGMVIRAPFQRAEPLPAPWDRAFLPGVSWSPDGNLAYLRGCNGSANPRGELQAIFHAATGKLQASRFPVETASLDGRVTAWSTGNDVMVHSAERKSPVSVYDVEQHGPILEALRHARYPAGVKSLIDVQKEKGEGHHWYLGPTALMPDGQRLFFACNAGSLSGNTGNTAYGFFAVDLRTRKVAVLCRLGAFDGFCMPAACLVSPDGKRMAILYNARGGAVSNPWFLRIVDLETQRSRELLHRNPRHRKDENRVAGLPSWSPDGRYVVQDAYYYEYDSTDGRNEIRPWKPGRGRGKKVSASEWEPQDEDYAALIFDAATGQQVRELPGALAATWGR